ncbi:MAG: hypothetical protein ACLFUB_20460 [Cyclobacteriaceae bacterium]
MHLDELKKQWQAEHHQKIEGEIHRLIAGKSKAASARARKKALLESGALGLVLLVFMTGLDPERNELWVNLSFTLVILSGIANNLLLYRRLVLNAQGAKLSQAIHQQTKYLWQQIQLSVLYSVLFFGATFAFLLLRVNLDGRNVYWLLLIIPFSVVLRSWFEIRRWRKDLRQLNLCQMELTHL